MKGYRYNPTQQTQYLSVVALTDEMMRVFGWGSMQGMGGLVVFREGSMVVWVGACWMILMIVTLKAMTGLRETTM
jgi:hypothetical protein